MTWPAMRAKFGLFAILTGTICGVALLSSCGSGSGGGTKPPVVGGITVYPGSANISENATAQFTAYSGATIISPTWNVLSGSGTISNSGLFTAPGSTETDTIQAVSGSNASPAITINVVAPQPVAVNPAAIAVPAGGSQQFTSATDCASTTWSLIATGSSNPGTITNGAASCGLYTAPPNPPRTGAVTIIASSGGNNGSATVTILFSNVSLNSLANPVNPKPYAFAYRGDDGSGLLSVVGSFLADGNGNITGGTEDLITSGSNGSMSTTIQASTYTVGPDGRTTATISTGLGSGVVWQFVLTSNQHALMIRFDKSATGSGTIDLQNPGQFSVVFSLGNYSFGLSGRDSKKHPTGVAGRVFANGNATFPLGSGILDLNDSGYSASPTNVTDSELQGGVITAADPSTGRGTLQLNCPSFETVLGATSGIAGTLDFVYYVIDATHVKVLETDSIALLSGDFYSAPPTSANMTGTQVFVVGGSDGNGNPYGMGGGFVSASSGVFDLNDNGTLTSPPTGKTNITAATPTVDTTTGRINLGMTVNNNKSYQFAAYLFNYTAANGLASTGAVLLEIDTNVEVGTGVAYAQTSATAPQGSFGLNLTGTQVELNGGRHEQDIDGQFSTGNSGVLTGRLDINDTANSGNLVSGEPLTSASAIATAGINGRGNPLTLANKFETNTLSYYVIDTETALLLEMDGNRVMTGTLASQF